MLVGLGSVQRLPGVKERVRPTIFEEVLAMRRSCDFGVN